MGYIGFDDLRVVLGINEKTDSSVVQKGPKFLTRLGDTAILIAPSSVNLANVSECPWIKNRVQWSLWNEYYSEE